jgi:hypothetical protein
MTITPVLIPLNHLDGYHVWIGNHLAGACWHDRWGYRWHIASKPPARIIFGIADSMAECVKLIVANHE